MITSAGVVPETTELSTLSDGEILRAVAGWAQAERRATARLLRHLGELDARRLYLGAGCASTFAYCTDVLRMSEPAAYHRITAARAGRRFPELLARLASGDLHLSAICLLAPELTEANAAHWIARASGQSKRAIERMLAEEKLGLGVVPSSVAASTAAGAGMSMAVPARAAFARVPMMQARAESGGVAHVGRLEQAGSERLESAASAPAPASVIVRDVVEVRPCAAIPAIPAVPAEAREHGGVALQLPKLSFIADPELQELLSQARDLVSHRNPSGDLAKLLRLALRALIANTERRRFGQRAGVRDGEHSAQGAAQTDIAQTVIAQAAVAPAVTASAATAQAITVPAAKQTSARPARSAPRGAESMESSAEAEHADSAARRRAARWRSRYIPIAVRRAVWERDAGCCAFVSHEGHRCATRAFLQFHHRIEFARGGLHTVENISLRCGPHNRYEARSEAEAEPARARDLVRAPVRRSNENSNSPRGKCAPGKAWEGRMVSLCGSLETHR